MSMHLEGPWLTTSSTKKRQHNMTKAERLTLEQRWRERNAYLKSMGVNKESFEEYLSFVFGHGPKTKEPVRQIPALFTPRKPYVDPARDTSKYKSLNGGIDSGPALKIPDKVYTGTKIKGIGTMHKSNAVPVFSDDEAVAIANMRR